MKNQTLIADIITTSPVKHSVRPLQPNEVIGNCKICQKPLRGKAQLNVMLDEKTRLHSTCLLSKIILESDGDLAAAVQEYGIPLEILQRRAQRLSELGKLNETGVLV